MSFLLDVSILLRTFKTILVGLRHEDDSFLAVDDRLEDLMKTSAPDESAPPSEGGPA